MGSCFGSRYSRRFENSEDYNTSPLNFLGGEGFKLDKCPLDKIALAYCGEKDDFFKVDGLKCTDEDQAKKIYTETFGYVKAALEKLLKEFGEDPADHKKGNVGGKYTPEDAIGQLKKVLEEFKEASGIEIEGEKKEEAAEGEEEKKDDTEMEGGDDMMEDGAMMMEMMDEVVKEDPYKDDSLDSYKGFENLPGLFLRTSTVYPYFGDLIKTNLLKHEFGFNDDKQDNMDFAGAAALLSVAVQAAESAETEVFFAGFAGEEDFLSLKELIEAKGELVFPGLVGGFDTKEQAIANSVKFEEGNLQKLLPVVYSIKTKAVKAVAVKQFVSRMHAKIESAEISEDGPTVVKLVANEPEKILTIAEYKEDLANPAAEEKEEEKKEEEKMEEMMEEEKMDEMME